jgi:hypothetical protein
MPLRKILKTKNSEIKVEVDLFVINKKIVLCLKDGFY